MRWPILLRHLRWSPACLIGLLWVASPASIQAQPFQVGQIVSTNFGLVNRYRWTNDNGQIFASNAVFRLSDFAGKIVMFEFFAVW